MKLYQDKIFDVLKEHFPAESIKLDFPPDPRLGDIALPCFSLAKVLRKSPMDIVKMIAEKIDFSQIGIIEKIQVEGGYVNFYIDKSVLVKDTLDAIILQRDTFGSSMSGKGKSAFVEHTSINPNASPHIGRARNALIGDVIVRLLRFEGYKVESHYFVNDVGKQIAMLVLGAKSYAMNVDFKNLLDIYVEINKRVEENPELEKEIFDLLKKLEDKDEATVCEFKSIVDICIEGQTQIFKKLGITYDFFDYESKYIWDNLTNDLLQQLEQKGKLFEDAEGRLVANLEGYNLTALKNPVLVLTRSDKTSLYPLRDIAYTIDKVKHNVEKNIIVLGEDQKVYFQQIGVVLDILGYRSPESVHYSFVLLPEGKMSTRSGTVVLFEDFMDEAVNQAVEEMKKRRPDEEIDLNIARAIAYGAVKYSILKVANDKSVIFSWESALSFEGNSAPYLQYSYVRINSILRKYQQEIHMDVDFSVLQNEYEVELVKTLAMFSMVVQNAVESFSPHLIANYVYDVAKKFSAFYNNCSVVNADNEELVNARLVLVSAVRQVIKNCFEILGIEKIEYM